MEVYTTHLFYGDPTLPDLPPTKFLSQRGTRQGCPLGAQLFALGLHPLLCALARLIGPGGAVISYANDIHLVGPPSTIALALKSLLQPSPPLDASALRLQRGHPPRMPAVVFRR